MHCKVYMISCQIQVTVVRILLKFCSIKLFLPIYQCNVNHYEVVISFKKLPRYTVQMVDWLSHLIKCIKKQDFVKHYEYLVQKFPRNNAWLKCIEHSLSCLWIQRQIRQTVQYILTCCLVRGCQIWCNIIIYQDLKLIHDLICQIFRLKCIAGSTLATFLKNHQLVMVHITTSRFAGNIFILKKKSTQKQIARFGDKRGRPCNAF